METTGTNQTQRHEKITWTERVRELAEEFDVDPKLVSQLAEGIKDDITNNQGKLCLDLIQRILQGQAVETEIAEVEELPVGEAPQAAEPKVKEPGTADRTETIVKQWLLERDYITKLAFVILDGYGMADHQTDSLYDEVTRQFESDILTAAENLPAGLSNKEILLSGIAAEVLLSERM